MPTIAIDGHIGWSITPRDIRSALAAAKGKPVKIEINSPGGIVSDGIAIHNLIRDYQGSTEMVITGMAASMGSYVALAGDKIKVHDNAVFMIHNALGIVIGNHHDMRKRANLIESLSNILARKYSEISGKPLEEIQSLMDDESYFYGEEIVDEGFADEIIKAKKDKDKSKASALAEAEALVTACIEQVRQYESENDESGKIAAIIDELPADMQAFDDDEYDQAESVDDIEAPFPNEHACRVREPGEFQRESFRRINRKADGKNFSIIIGRLKGKTTTTTQAYRYPRDEWTETEARRHCTRNNGKRFEPATNKGCTACGKETEGNKSIRREDNMPSLAELLEQNPEAKKQYDADIQAAIEMGQETASKESKATDSELEGRIKTVVPILRADRYPKSVTEMAVKVLQGETSKDALTAAVTVLDAQKEGENSTEGKQTTKNGKETPPEKPDEASDDGMISDGQSYAAEVARFKGQDPQGGDGK